MPALALVQKPDPIGSAPPEQPQATRPPRVPLGQILLDMRAVEPGNLLKAVALREREEARLGDILLTHGWVNEADLMAALSVQWGTKAVDVIAARADTRLIDRLGAAFCLAHGVLPWRRIGGATVIATARPEDFARMRAELPPDFGAVVMTLAPERDILQAVIDARQTALIRRAETRVPDAESCRSQDGRIASRVAAAALATLTIGAFAAPALTFILLASWAVLTLIACSVLKLACFAAEARTRRMARTNRPAPARPLARLPMVSVMVPLFHEDDIAPRLIRRLGRIDYPKELFDVVLVVEEEDTQTRAALAGRGLPRWMRIVTVPDGPIRTKPRAMNYALDFCRGSIIGVWDAEDAPEPQQVRKVVRRFAECPEDVACLQGILDFYNAGHNWLTRCFAVEYATWFRAFLPGLARLGFVVPLGGTTLFFRRDVLEALGGWDAHNVTEDADLGLRIARHGYRTEVINTVTEEEPNARPMAWIRQRSRWQKGFAMTWACHMRSPRRLWRDLGAKRFVGVQILLLGTLSQSIFLPVLWSFWLLLLGLPHPLSGLMPFWLMLTLAGLFAATEVLTMAVGFWAVCGPEHRHLKKWVPTMHVYFPLSALSSYKALYEWVTRPFFWDKTAHGVVAAQSDPAELLPVLLLTDPVDIPADAAPATLPQPAFATRPRIRLVPPADGPHPPARPERTLGSAIAAASRRPGIEFQPCFEGFGDM